MRAAAPYRRKRSVETPRADRWRRVNAMRVVDIMALLGRFLQGVHPIGGKKRIISDGVVSMLEAIETHCVEMLCPKMRGSA